jgi:hypothetical protein
MTSENDPVPQAEPPDSNDPVPNKPAAAALAAGNGDAGDYGADQIEALKGLEGIRMRPGMYIGGTDSRGLNHLVFEVVDNSIDEFVAGHGTLISVHINVDGSITCSDDGRGIPVGPMPEMDNKPAVEVVLTSLHAGGKFDRLADLDDLAEAMTLVNDMRARIPVVWGDFYARALAGEPIPLETRARVRTALIHARHRETHNIRFGQRKVDIAFLQADPALHGLARAAWVQLRGQVAEAGRGVAHR